MKKSIATFLMISLFPIISFAASENHGNPQPDMKLLFSTINFAILATLLFVLLRKPLKNLFVTRSKELQSTIGSTRENYNRELKRNKDIRDRLGRIDEETSKLIKKFEDDANQQSKHIIQHAESFASRLRDDAVRITDLEIIKAREELKATTAVLARNLAQNIIEKEVKDADQDQLISNYLTRFKEVS